MIKAPFDQEWARAITDTPIPREDEELPLPSVEEIEEALDEALKDTFPASDPPSVTRHPPQAD